MSTSISSICTLIANPVSMRMLHTKERVGIYKEAVMRIGEPISVRGGAAYRDNTMHARAGYLLYKFNNRSLLKEGSNPTDWGRSWIYFRLADFYLYYAEVCNEINPNDANIIKYLDLVRERAGIPGYKDLATKAAPYGKNIIGNQELQREAIYRERIIEMLGEGNYYFDMHRWMRAGWSQDGDYR